MIRVIHYIFTLLFITGCSVYARYNLDEQFGKASPLNRNALVSRSGVNFWKDVKPILDARCVSCHSCYDSPCQLNLGSHKGLERGAHKDKVYQGSRLIAAKLTRLLQDGETVQDWREKGFSPVLNERSQNPEANIQSSVLAKMLMLKHSNPVFSENDIATNFEFSLNRKQQCPQIEQFDKFAKKNPLWGMPYGLPSIPEPEYTTLLDWLREGATYPNVEPLDAAYLQKIASWEKFLNGDSLKQQLMSRYLFEHLFVSNLYFEGLSKRQYFRLYRSKTPPGTKIQKISTRRPYENPRVSRVYYRLEPLQQTIVAKTHMPYALSPVRMQRFNELFLAENYTVKKLPSYRASVAANPFVAFSDIPVQSRYRFLLDEAQNTIMGFIKGPACRGQLALSVIQDHFWILFVDPDSPVVENSNEFINRVAPRLRLPSEKNSTTLNPLSWIRYSKHQKRFHAEKIKFLSEVLPDKHDINISLVWDGDGWNDNAALTVYRHFDSASVEKGLLGKEPKTAWLIGFSLLERIHYLLVAGFDVYGNVGHQLYTRLYMDFLRMDGEFNFLALLPLSIRKKERDHWYDNSNADITTYMSERGGKYYRESGISYESDNPKLELFSKIKKHLGSVINTDLNLNPAIDPNANKLLKLSQFSGNNVTLLPEMSVLMLKDASNSELATSLYTLLHNVERKNVSHLLLDKNNLLAKQDYLSVLPGIVGSYPNVLFQVDVSELDNFISDVVSMQTEQDYYALKIRFGIARSDPMFWEKSDQMLAAYKRLSPLRWGIIDYSRLEHHKKP